MFVKIFIEFYQPLCSLLMKHLEYFNEKYFSSSRLSEHAGSESRANMTGK